MKLVQLHYSHIPEMEYEQLERAMSSDGPNDRFMFISYISLDGVILALFNKEDGAYDEASVYTLKHTPNLHGNILWALDKGYDYIEYHVDGVKPEIAEETFNWHSEEPTNEIWDYSEEDTNNLWEDMDETYDEAEDEAYDGWEDDY